MDVDTIIIGAGISGLNAAYRLRSTTSSYLIVESRASMGGTWDLFKYPGIRSDSDVFTFGFAWAPWGTEAEASLASGDEIKEYMAKSAKSAGITPHIRYNHAVESAAWSTKAKRWTLSVRTSEGVEAMTCRFILLGTGYYDYETPLQVDIPGIDTFKGEVLHPQFWPEGYDYSNKHVVIIGSGATAVTMVPSLAPAAASVTMLQRSPGYIFSLPSSNLLTYVLFLLLPNALARWLNRLIWLARSYVTTAFCLNFPGVAKKYIRAETVKRLPPGAEWPSPRYDPWEQRFCASKDGDFFEAIRSGKASVVTDRIREVTGRTIELEGGGVLHPDVIVTATGLRLKFAGGIKMSVDGQAVDVAGKFAWKSAMLQDTPNLVFLTGYERASWTLGADVSAQLYVRLRKVMKAQGKEVAVPTVEEARRGMEAKPMMSLSSTYVQNVAEVLPKGGEGQWAPKTNYFADVVRARWGDVATGLKMM